MTRVSEVHYDPQSVAGESQGADEDVRIVKERGLPVYYSLDAVPRFVREIH